MAGETQDEDEGKRKLAVQCPLCLEQQDRHLGQHGSKEPAHRLTFSKSRLDFTKICST